jgi:hypothetical protein
MTTTNSIAIALGFTGYILAAILCVAYRGQVRVNKAQREHFSGEEERNRKSYDSGIRIGLLAGEIGNVSVLKESRGMVYADGTTDTGWGGFGGSEHTPELSTPTNGNSAA